MNDSLKKILRIIFTIGLAASLIAILFAPINRHSQSSKIVISIFPLYDIVNNIIDDEAIDTKLLIKPGTELHDYEPTPEDITTLKNADIIIYNGGESEEWIKTIIDQNNNATIIRAMDYVDLLQESSEEYDEHIWTSPNNVIKLTNEISAKLQKIYPNIASNIANNSTNYANDWKKLHEKFQELAQTTQTRTIAIADHFPFAYFINDYKFKYISAYVGCSHDAEPSAAKMSEIINKINQEHIPTIYTIDTLENKTAKTIKNATNTKITLLYSGETITVDEYRANKSLLDMFNDNYLALKELYNGAD